MWRRMFSDLRKDEEQDTHEDGWSGGAHRYLRTLHCPNLHSNNGLSYPSSTNDLMCMLA
jgi:hypothetical protein